MKWKQKGKYRDFTSESESAEKKVERCQKGHGRSLFFGAEGAIRLHKWGLYVELSFAK